MLAVHVSVVCWGAGDNGGCELIDDGILFFGKVSANFQHFKIFEISTFVLFDIENQ